MDWKDCICGLHKYIYAYMYVQIYNMHLLCINMYVFNMYIFMYLSLDIQLCAYSNTHVYLHIVHNVFVNIFMYGMLLHKYGTK